MMVGDEQIRGLIMNSMEKEPGGRSLEKKRSD